KGKTFATCVQTRSDTKVNKLISSFKNAAATCKSQLRSLGAATFAAQYKGVNHNLANAYGKCVSTLSEGQSAFGTSLLDLTPVPTSTASGAVAFTREYKVNPG